MKVKIEFEVEVPDHIEATQEELDAWLGYNFNVSGSINTSNPYYHQDVPEPIDDTFNWEII